MSQNRARFEAGSAVMNTDARLSDNGGGGGNYEPTGQKDHMTQTSWVESNKKSKAGRHRTFLHREWSLRVPRNINVET